MHGKGTKKNPLIVRVQSQKRAEVILKTCNDNGWQVIIGLEPGNTEDISDLENKLNPPIVVRGTPKTGRNDPCPCGGGKKYKKCCGG